MGKLFSVPLVDPVTQLVTFFRDDLGDGAVDFQIPAPLGAITAHAEGVEEVLPGEPIELTLADGIFTATVPITAADPLPFLVEVTFNPGLGSETTQMFPLTDRIIGFTVEEGADQLADPTIIRRTIRAASSNQWNQNQPDGSLMPTLVVTDPDGVELGEIPGAGGTMDIPSPRPDTVTITSVAAEGALDPAGGFVVLDVPGVPIPGIYPIILDDDEEE